MYRVSTFMPATHDPHPNFVLAPRAQRAMLNPNS